MAYVKIISMAVQNINANFAKINDLGLLRRGVLCETGSMKLPVSRINTTNNY